MHNRRHERFSSLALLFCSLAFVSPQAADDEYFAHAEKCFRQASTVTEINLNSGVYTEQVVVSNPLSIRVPAGYDGAVHQECMRRAGLERDVSKDPYLRIIEECRRDSEPIRRVVIGSKVDVKVPQSHDQAAYEACIRRRQGELEVDVLTD